MATLPENLSQLSQMMPKPEKDIGCQALVQTAGVSKHGFLRKMAVSWGGRLFDSVLSRKWSSKFVILRSGCVYIYSSETASDYDRAYSLLGFQEVMQCEGDFYKAGKWTFQVFDALQDSNRNRSMYFSASSENDMKDWIDAFQEEICRGNFAVFKQKPLVGLPAERRPVMPRLSEELREVIRRSIAFDKNVNICHEEKESSSESDDYSIIEEDELNATRTRRRPLPIPPSPRATDDVTKGETAVIGTAPKLLPRPTDLDLVAEKPKPMLAPVKPMKQDCSSAPADFRPLKQDPASAPPPPTPVKPAKYSPASAPPPPPTTAKPAKCGTASAPPSAPLKPAKQAPVLAVPLTPAKQDLPSTLPRPGLAKPTNAVKPFPPQPATSSGPPNLRDRMTPQPPFLKDLRQAINGRSSEDYEGRALYVEGDNYGQSVSGEECMTDPLIRASYWRQESEKALEIMQSINKSGVFLLRDAADGLDFKTLMVRASEIESSTGIIKYKITKEASQTYTLNLGQSSFQSLKELIQYYQNNPLPNRSLKLTKPYLEVWKSN